MYFLKELFHKTWFSRAFLFPLSTMTLSPLPAGSGQIPGSFEWLPRVSLWEGPRRHLPFPCYRMFGLGRL